MQAMDLSVYYLRCEGFDRSAEAATCNGAARVTVGWRSQLAGGCGGRLSAADEQIVAETSSHDVLPDCSPRGVRCCFSFSLAISVALQNKQNVTSL